MKLTLVVINDCCKKKLLLCNKKELNYNFISNEHKIHIYNNLGRKSQANCGTIFMIDGIYLYAFLRIRWYVFSCGWAPFSKSLIKKFGPLFFIS